MAAAAILENKKSLVSRRIIVGHVLIFRPEPFGPVWCICGSTIENLVKLVDKFKFSLMLYFFDENVKIRYFGT